MLFLIDDGKILLFKRLNTWFGNNEFSVPGGMVDTGEEPETAVIREIKEEVDISVETTNLTLFHTGSSHMNDRDFESYYYTAQTWTGQPKNLEPHRHTELGWYDLNDLPANTMAIVKEMIHKL